jgi:hypothetical protein
VLLLWTLFLPPGQAQVGGRGVFQVLRMPPSARAAALGGEHPLHTSGRDLGASFQNPALLGPEHRSRVSLNAATYLADIGYGYVGYADSLRGLGWMQAGLQYINYGDFARTDVFGNAIGSFSAAEYLLHVGKAWQVDSFRVGVNLKMLYSQLEEYTAGGAALDLSVTRLWNEGRIQAAFLVRHLGYQLWRYHEEREALPLDVQLAGALKLANAPFRFGLLLHHLHQPDLTFDRPEEEREDVLSGFEPQDDSPTLAEKMLRHVVFSTELLLSEHFHLRGGYHFMRRQELTLDNQAGGVGFSWGFGFRINRFHINYGRASYHVAEATNTFSITTALRDWRAPATATSLAPQ